MESVKPTVNDGEVDETLRLFGAHDHMQGLFLDLLSCVSGAKHPRIPPNHPIKPMTGFLDIVEAFNDIAKLQTAGSGIVCEVGSDESVSNMKTTTSPADPPLIEDSQTKLETCLNNNSMEKTKYPTQENTGDPEVISEDHFLDMLLHADDFIDKALEKQCLNDEAENIQCETINAECDTVFSVANKSDETKDKADDSDSYATDDERTTSEEQPDDHILINLTQEVEKYSKELKEIEKLIQNFVPPMYKPTPSQKDTPFVTDDRMNNNFIHKLADNMVSPRSALEMMYNMESVDPTRNKVFEENPKASNNDSLSSSSSNSSIPNWSTDGFVHCSLLSTRREQRVDSDENFNVFDSTETLPLLATKSISRLSKPQPRANPIGPKSKEKRENERSANLMSSMLESFLSSRTEK